MSLNLPDHQPAGYLYMGQPSSVPPMARPNPNPPAQHVYPHWLGGAGGAAPGQTGTSGPGPGARTGL